MDARLAHPSLLQKNTAEGIIRSAEMSRNVRNATRVMKIQTCWTGQTRKSVKTVILVKTVIAARSSRSHFDTSLDPIWEFGRKGVKRRQNGHIRASEIGW